MNLQKPHLAVVPDHIHLIVRNNAMSIEAADEQQPALRWKELSTGID
jgi:hypothetical protein